MILKIKGIKRSYLRMCALYRRAAGKSCGLDFSKEALVECFYYESLGNIRPSYRNGYYAGKRFMDITVKDALEEISKGNACKYEFYTSVSGWYWKKVLSNIVIKECFFPFGQPATYIINVAIIDK